MYLDIVKAYRRRAQLQKVQFDVQQGQSRDFVIDNEGTLRKGTKMCAPCVHKLSKEIFLSKCFTCQQVKLEHQRKSPSFSRQKNYANPKRKDVSFLCKRLGIS